MNYSSDVLESLRPEPLTLDPAWSKETLTRILDSDTPPAAIRDRTGRRRVALVGLAAALTSVAGVGVAYAGGLMSGSLSDVYSSWQTGGGGHPDVDPATAERVATAPGPNGTVFSVLSAGDGQWVCRTSIVESGESAALPHPISFTDVIGSFCSGAPSAPTFGGTTVSYQDVAAGFIVSAGNAVRAEVTTKDGQEYPALLVKGDFWGWFPKSAQPTLVGYAADGSVVGTLRLY